jgi:hypothetical protein
MPVIVARDMATTASVTATRSLRGRVRTDFLLNAYDAACNDSARTIAGLYQDEF